MTVELLDRLLGVRPIRIFHEREAARAAGLPVNRQDDLRGRRHGSEVGAKVGFGGSVRQIADEQTDSQSNLS